MKKILSVPYIIYQACIALPIMIIMCFVVAVFIIIFTALGFGRFCGYYPGIIWGKTIITSLLLPVKVVGRENIRKGQTYVIAANHQSNLDAFLIYGWIGTPFRWIMKKSLLKIPFVGWACKTSGHIFVDRDSRTDGAKSLLQAEHVLKDGISIMIFPEGTRSKDGKLGRFKKGAFTMSTQMNVPVLPVTIDGTHQAMPRGRFHATWHRITLTIHPEIPAPDTTQLDERGKMAALIQLSEETRKAISSALPEQ